MQLPSACNNQSVVQIRWAVWRGTESGNSSAFGIDNVTAFANYVDASSVAPTLDGNLGVDEYGPGNSFKFTGSGLSFGGPLGGSTAAMYFKSDSTSLYIAYQIGSSALNDSVAVLLDTGSASPATYPNDTGGGDQRAISRMLNNSTVLPALTDFRASYALVFPGANQNPSDVVRFYTITPSAVNFTTFTGATWGTGTSSGTLREIRIPLSLLGSSAGATIKFIAGLSNPSGTPASLSNESIPSSPALNAAAQTNTAGGFFSNFGAFTTSACQPVVVNTQPTPSSQSVCQNAAVTYTAAGNGGSGTVSYAWQQSSDNVDFSAPAAGTNTLASYSPPTATVGTMYYRCVISSSCGTPTSVTTNSVQLAVSAAPAPPTSASASSSAYCTDAVPTSITLSATPDAGATLNWYSAATGGTLLGPGNLVLSGASRPTTAGTFSYFARSTGGSCESASTAVAITVSAATVIGTQPVSQSACVGGSAAFTVAATGTSLHYTWRRGTTPIPGAPDSPTYSIASAALSDAGTNYNVVVSSDACGSATSSNVSLTVTPPPDTGLSVLANLPSVCSGSSTTITVAGAEFGVGYRLRIGTTEIQTLPGTGANLSFSTGTLLADTTFNVLATRPGCSSVQLTQTATVTVNPLPSAPTGTSSYSATTGSPLTISATVGPNETVDWYTFSCGGTSVATASLTYSIPAVPQGTTTYFARARSTITGCTSTSCLSVAVTGASQVTISQLYGGGGNTYTRDFVEIFNRGTTPVTVSGWTLQYSSDGGTIWTNALGSSVSLTGTIPAGGYYLIGLATTAGGALLPAVDFSGSQNMSATSGKIALVNTTAALSGANPAAHPSVIDFVGYGPNTTTTTGFEGTGPAPSMSSTTAVFRFNNGCTDTNQNGADFATGTPRPRNSSSPRCVCVGGLSESVTDASAASAIADGVLNNSEYGPGNSNEFGGDGARFGGMIGYFANTTSVSSNVRNPRVFFKSDATGLNMALRLGASFGGAGDTAVVLLDYKSGGVVGGTAIPFDNGDTTQRAVARALLATLPSGFTVDAAIGFNSFGVFAYDVSTGGLAFQSGNTAAGTGLSNGQARELRIPYTNMPGFSAGETVKFIVLLNNGAASPNTDMADESVPVSPSFSGSNPSGTPLLTGGVITNYNRFITVCASPTASLVVGGPGGPLCAGNTTIITVVASEVGVSYQLRDSTNAPVGVPQTGTGGTLSFPTSTLSTLGAHTFNVLATRTSCASSIQLTQTATVTVYDAVAPSGAAVTPTSVCAASGTIELSVSNPGSGGTLNWYSDACGVAQGGTYVGSGSPLTITAPSVPTTYFARIESPCGNTSCALASVSINAPTTTTNPSAASQCFGSTTTFSVTGGGSGTLSYQWEQSTSGGGTWSNAAGSGVATDQLQTSPAALDGTLFRCVVTGLCGAATSTAATLTVNAPTATSSPLPQTVCAGDSATFSVIGSGAGTLTYQWRRNGTPISGASGNSYIIPSVAAADEAAYSCQVSGLCGIATSGAAQLQVNAATTATISGDVTTCEGTSATFTATPAGTGPFSYQWKKDGSPIGGATQASFTIAVTAAGDAGAYSCAVTGTCGSATSSSAVLVVQASPTATASVSGGSPVVQVGQTIMLTGATSQSPSFSWSVTGGSGTFTSGTGSGPGADTSFTLTSGSTGGTLALTLSADGTGPCSTPATQTINLSIVAPAAVTSFSANPGATVCDGASVSLIATASGTSPITYTFKRDGAPVQSGPSGTLSLASASATDAGSYTVEVENTYNTTPGSSAPLSLVVNPSTTTTDPSSSAQCVGSSTTFTVTGSGVGLSYQWEQSTSGGAAWSPAAGTGTTTASMTTSAAASDGTLFRCVVTGTCGSATSEVATLSVTSSPITMQPPSMLNVCAGASPQITVGASGSGLSFQWEVSLDQGMTFAPVTSGGTQSTYVVPVVTIGDNGKLYRCVVTSSSCGAATSATTELAVVPNPNVLATIDLQGAASGTVDRCVTFEFYTLSSCPAPAITINQVVTFTDGRGVASVPGVPCGNYTGVTVRERLHTLRRTATAQPYFDTSDPSNLVISLTNQNGGALESGNLNNDAFIDILDFGTFLGQFGQVSPLNTFLQSHPGAIACDFTGRDADSSGEGVVGTEDFGFIRFGFLHLRDQSPCGAPIGVDPDAAVGPLARLSVNDPVVIAQPSLAWADVNHDGIINEVDVAQVLTNGVATCPADFNGDRALSVQDVFDYLAAWFNGHPATDLNRAGGVNVQDIFDFMAAWFGGC